VKRQFNFREWPKSKSVASFGFYAAPIQKVVKKWSNEIGAHWCEFYTPFCYGAVMRCGDIKIPMQADGHREFVLDLLQAYRQLSDTKKAVYWLLLLGEDLNEAAPDGQGIPFRLKPFEEIAKLIKSRGGPKFDARALNKAFERLHPIATESAW
jgi:hypothetical protein